MTEKIQKVINDMYANKTEVVYQEFQEIVPQIQNICNNYLEENSSEEASVKVQNLIRNILREYEKMDIVALADILQYDLLEDVCYHKSTIELRDNMHEKEFLKKNISALEKRGISISDEKEYNRIENSTERCFISRVSPEKAAKKWGMFIEEIEDYATLFVFGLSEGSHIRELVKRTNDTNQIVVYEPSEEHFISVINVFDLSDLIENERIDLFIDNINGAGLWSNINSNITYSNRKVVKWYVLPNYDISYTDIMNQYLRSIMNQMRLCDLGRNLALGEENKILLNMRHNTFDRIKQYHISQLKKEFERISIESTPAVLVSAGPSLDKNIEQLRGIYKKAFIVVVDTALKSMVGHKINFHMGVTVDPVKPVSMFENEEICNIPMLVDMYSNNDVIKMHKGKRFYCDNYNDFLPLYIDEKNKNEGKQIKKHETVYLSTGGSVANNAFSFLVYLGFKTIILVGQDLAFTDDKAHTGDAYDSEEENKKHVEESPSICYVKDIYGNDVKTDLQMYSYINWFESQADKYKGEIDVVDATEGGARIAGTKIMTLKDAIDEYCNNTVDITKILTEVEPAYSEEEIKYLFKELHDLKDNMVEAKTLIRKNIQFYRNILEGISDIKGLIENINENNVYLQNMAVYNLIVRYSQRIEYEINENVFAKDEDSIEVIAKKYIRLYEGYLESIKRIVEDWSEYEL